MTARLSQGGYVFPVFGTAAFGNTFGAFRADVHGKWHHGEDLVAPEGTPLLAVADGSLFTTGAAANPTLTIVALAARQADYIAEQLAGRHL